MMPSMRALLIGSLCLLSGCGGAAVAKPPAGAAAAAAEDLSPDGRLARGTTRLAQSRYADAESDLVAALGGSKKSAALLALSELMLITGRYPEALARAKQALSAGADPQAVALAEARTLAVSGEVDAALARLRQFPLKDASPDVRLELGELLLEVGRRAEAEPVLLTLIEDFNEDRVPL
jgi:hypothetical protein